MQVSYDPLADRLLWQVRTRSGELMAVWLTRRLTARLWPPFQQLVARAGLPPASAGATVLPEARQMLDEAARQRPLPTADFSAPFSRTPATQPLGAEPLLPEAIDLGAGPQGRGLSMKLRERSGRSLGLQLTDDLATALLRLFEQALVASEWFAVARGPAPEAAPPTGQPGTTLN